MVGHASPTGGNTKRVTGTEPTIGAVAKRAAAAGPSSGIDLGRGGRDGATAWIAPYKQDATPGLHAVEKTAHFSSASVGDASGARFCGTDRAAVQRTGGVRGGVGIGARANAGGDE